MAAWSGDKSDAKTAAMTAVEMAVETGALTDGCLVESKAD